MKQVEYQKEYINKIADTAIEYLNDSYRDTTIPIIFKAPTGSGKTYMISQAMTKIVKEQAGIASYCFIWLSVNSLHEQSKQALSRYLEDERLLDCIGISEIQNNTVEENEIVFVNWDSLIKENNIFRMDNEQNWNLENVVANTKEEGLEIILVIDESHRTAKADKAQEVIREINPRLIIEMTATPLDKRGVPIDIPLGKVINEGMIKREVQINPGSKNINENKDLLEFALKKRKELKRAYEEMGSDINPLLLIQIPNKKQTDSSNPEDYIIGLLSAFGITKQNGKLETRLSGDNIAEIDERVKPNNSEIEVLIFKEAIALGWDCPRAAILFLQREWKQERYSFNIQTLGRIMRMPEQTHYDSQLKLNVGYVFSASDNFEIVQELADDYVTNFIMERDEELNTKPIKLLSEFIRRKRELTRLSGDFRNCLMEAAKEMKSNLDKLNYTVSKSYKSVGTEGTITEIDKNKQEVDFANKVRVLRDRVEVANSYLNFCAEMSAPYAKTRSVQIIMSSLRSWFKENRQIGDEDQISYIVMFNGNKSTFQKLIDLAKEKYKNLPTKDEIIVPTKDWNIPQNISVFTDYETLQTSDKSIIKEANSRKLFVKKNKNGKIDLSQPEIKFINELEQTDDDVLWWFKNGTSESKYFGIAYKKQDWHYYGFYPDFIIRTKKEIVIVEIKDDKDFKPENALKLQTGRDYILRANNEERTYFFMLSPVDYHNFFTALKNLTIDEFLSVYEENLLRYNQSRRKLIESEDNISKNDKEYLDLLSELDKTIDDLKDQKLKNELLEMELSDAQNNVKSLSEIITETKSHKTEAQTLNIPTPFNICILGEVSDESLIRSKLNKYFQKQGIKTNDWDFDFFNNTKLQNTDVLRSLVKGQTKYNVIITGQIQHHSGKGNKKANIISELKNEKYIPHIIGCNPKDFLTADCLIKNVNEYFKNTYIR